MFVVQTSPDQTICERIILKRLLILAIKKCTTVLSL